MYKYIRWLAGLYILLASYSLAAMLAAGIRLAKLQASLVCYEVDIFDVSG